MFVSRGFLPSSIFAVVIQFVAVTRLISVHLSVYYSRLGGAASVSNAEICPKIALAPGKIIWHHSLAFVMREMEEVTTLVICREFSQGELLIYPLESSDLNTYKGQ